MQIDIMYTAVQNLFPSKKSFIGGNYKNKDGDGINLWLTVKDVALFFFTMKIKSNEKFRLPVEFMINAFSDAGILSNADSPITKLVLKSYSRAV